jgi:Tfp pilus assembly protein PilN
MFTPMHADTLEGDPSAEGEARPSSAPTHARSGVSEVARTNRTIPTARVNLMPPEILLGRRVKRVKRRILVGIALVLVGTIGGLGWYKYDGSRATSGLAAEQAAVDALKVEQQTYAELLQIDLEAGDIDRSLKSVMGDDVAWDSYLQALAASAPAGVQITAISVVLSGFDPSGVSVPAGQDSLSGSLDTSGQEHMGSLTVTGLAPNHGVVAAWVNSMTEVEGFLVPYILGSSVVVEGAPEISFSIEITLSSAIRSLRYGATVPETPTDGQGG